MAAYRPLPPHPPAYPNQIDLPPFTDPYRPYYPSTLPPAPDVYREPQSIIPASTFLHKGFYDLLAMIPTPNPSRLLWRAAAPAPPPQPTVGGPRYENIGPNSPHPLAPANALKKGRRISKDMVSRPTGFVHLIHASDADQLEALLTRWGPDGIGKLGDPRWANPIKDIVRRNMQARAVNQVVNALHPSPGLDEPERVLRVVNGMSTLTSSTLTTAAQENVILSSPSPEGLPGKPLGNSTFRWAGGLHAHEELQESEEDSISDVRHVPEMPRVPRPIIPSLYTLDKAVSARIYFENLYFPLLRQPPSREQRRLAMEKDMEEMRLTQGQKEALRARWRQNETDYLRERRRKVNAAAFVKLKTIGHGAFGVVSLVKERSTGSLYAMKQVDMFQKETEEVAYHLTQCFVSQLRKADMLRKGQEGHVRAERDILKSASMVPTGAEWIVRLHYSFQDRDHLYLVLEYMGGGDLLNLLIERDVFEEPFTRFYVAEMILAIEACHRQGFIHRDIKPDNFLFDPEGHIKLSDFGLATDLHWAHDTSYYEQQRLQLLHKHGVDLEVSNGLSDNQRTRRMNRKDIELIMGGEGQGGLFTWRDKNRRKLAYSVCGTNSYMSPEVIRGHGYSYSCDWWSLGVIMFECLYGFPPFVSNSRHVTRQKILNWKQSLKFPSRPRVSPEGISLMQQLLCEPEDRLGSQASSSVSRPDAFVQQARRSIFIPPQGVPGTDGADLIKAHVWFRGIDWQNIRRYPAPYKPELRNAEDTRHFDDDIPAEPLAPANGAPADATKDLMLLDKKHGTHILNSRKALAFAGFTHKSPRIVSYLRADEAFDSSILLGQETIRGRTMARQSRIVGKSRPISL